MTNNNTASTQLSALQATIVVAVGIFFVSKAVVEVSIDLGKFAYNLGREMGAKYYASENVNPALSDATVAIEIEVKEVIAQVGNYLCGVALVASIVHAFYLSLPSIWEVRLEVRHQLRNLMNSDRVIALYN